MEVTVISPRISFSRDLDRPNDSNRGLDPSILDSGSDFDFCFTGTGFVSTADELFSDGKILPIEIKKIAIPARQNRGSVPNSSLRRPAVTPVKKMLKEFLSDGEYDGDGDGEEKVSPAKPFWQFRRSSSLNCDDNRNSSGGAAASIRSLHFLSRSNSTGSVPSRKQTGQSHRPGLQKQPSVSSRKSSSSSSSSSSYGYYPYRPQLKKCGSQGNAGRTGPVLNFPAPYISRVTVNLFRFGSNSIFCNGKLKSRKKK